MAGRNFGSGSSRETAPAGLKAFGIGAIIAATFARIFLRNAVNIGLPVLECPAAAAEIREGDLVVVDVAAGRITNERTGRTYEDRPLPAVHARADRRGRPCPLRAEASRPRLASPGIFLFAGPAPC